MSLNLGDRKENILAVVVEEYIRTAEPVGSRTVVKRGVKSSPATVRGEMSELEGLGLLRQPHASAGRLPTDQGFRYYVDRLMKRSVLADEDRGRLDSIYDACEMSAERLIHETARVLSELSRNVGIVMVVPAERSPLREIAFVEAGDRIRVILELSGGAREERLIKNDHLLSQHELNRLANLVNRFAPGRTLVGLRRELIRQMQEAKAVADLLLARAAELSERLVRAEEPELFIRGQANLLDLPEFSEVDAIRSVVRTLEQRSILLDMLDKTTLAPGMRVTIGGENRIEDLHPFSVLSCTYGRSGVAAGALGVIGPTRMEYARLIPMVRYTSELISECLRRNC